MRIFLIAVVIFISVVILPGVFPILTVHAQELPNVNVAQYTDAGELRRPENIDRWVFMSAGIGHGYNDATYDPGDPGFVLVVTMEPNAYEYFLANGRYANGTMFSLSFYEAMRKSTPQLHGIIQGAMVNFEIHVLDRERFVDQRAFFLYRGGASSTKMLPAGNDCVVCHNQHGEYDGTFTQFYPLLKAIIAPSN